MIEHATIGVVGAGAWGTALAQHAAHRGHAVRLWARDPALAAMVGAERTNPRYLPGITLDPAITPTADLADLADADFLLLTVPAQSLRGVLTALAPGETPLVLCAKGLEQATDLRLSEVAHAVHPGRPVAVLSGPNFAREVALGLPAATTLGCIDAARGATIAGLLSSPQFRVYWTDDLIGVEIGGAFKNVLAIAAGMVTGRGLGENAAAALITRGLAELARLGVALGARPETLTGLSGLGDLLLTAGSPTSRNMAFGRAIGQGADPKRLQAEPHALVEGVATARAAVRLAARHGVDLPIAEAVAAILDGSQAIEQALDQLMRRPLKAETAR